MILLWILGGLIGLYCLHRLALWMESRGWLFYINRRPKSSGIGTAFLDANSLLSSAARYRLEAQRLQEAQEEEDDDDSLDRGRR